MPARELQAGPDHAAHGARAADGAPADRRWVIFGVCVFLLVAVALVFGQTLRHEFVDYDDDENVYKNPDITRGFTPTTISRAFTSDRNAQWAPLTWLSHMLDWQLYGRWAGGHHLTNVLLHAATAIVCSWSWSG